MEQGIRDGTGSRVGKTIIFAREPQPRCPAQALFDEMYPQYGGSFCRVIDNYDPRAEELIDEFKGAVDRPELTIAISVDMLDTGIDVPGSRQSGLRQAGVFLCQVLADDRSRHPSLPKPVRPGQAQDALPDLRSLGQLRVVWFEVDPIGWTKNSRSLAITAEVVLSLGLALS